MPKGRDARAEGAYLDHAGGLLGGGSALRSGDAEGGADAIVGTGAGVTKASTTPLEGDGAGYW